MGKSQRLAIDELAQSQVQAFSTVNDAIDAIEGATQGLFTNSTDADYPVAELDFVRWRVYCFRARTVAGRKITFPTTVNGIPSDRELVVVNESNVPITIVGKVQPGNTDDLVIPAKAARVLHINAIDIRVLGEAGVLSGVPQTVALFTAGHPAHDTEILRYTFTENVNWPVNLAGTRGSVGISPAPSAALFLYKNGTQIGMVHISAGGFFTYTFPSAVPWAPGDTLTVRYESVEVGTITFNTQADTNDSVTVYDGTNAPVTFTYGGGGGQVAPGVNAGQSAANLATAINNSGLASTIKTSVVANVLTLTNLLPAGGGALTKSDADNDYTIVDFAKDSTSQNYAVTFWGARA